MPASRTLRILPVVLGFFFAVFAWSVVGAGDDAKGKKRNEEEDDKPAQTKDKGKDAAKPTGGKKRAEEEDDKAAKADVSKLVDAATPAVKKAAAPAAGDLAEAANATRHPKLKNLFADFVVPHDIVNMKKLLGVTVDGNTTGGGLRVEPVPLYIADIKEMRGRLTLNVIDQDGTPVREESGTAGTITSINYYEQLAADEVKKFLGVKYTTYDSSNLMYLSRMDQLLGAEKVLSTVMRFHESARQTGKRMGDNWDEVEGKVRAGLLEVLLEQMEVLADATSWDEAFVLTRRIIDTYNAPGDHKLIARPLADLLRRALADKNFAQDRMKEARERLRKLEDQFPNSDVLKPIGESLQAHAKGLFERAKDEAKDGKNMEAALALLTQAEETWPELPGLRAYRVEIDKRYQVLQVSMRTMPQYLSPGWACTDSEHRAVDMLFESLVALAPDEEGAMYYRACLAEGRPRVMALGRVFKMPRNARWSDDLGLTVSDVQYTLRQLQANKLVGRSAAWGELLNVVQAEGDPFRVKVRLNQGLLEPLAAMSFKILPARAMPDPTSRDFALAPITSGPFLYKGRRSNPANNQQYAAFESNPRYGVRAEKLGLPRIKEVRVYQNDDPVKPMKAGALDLALDLSGEQALALQKDGKFVVPMPSERSVNRRVWFLAANNLVGALANADVRVALARAIPREKLLDDHFRKGLDRKVHRALNGPYPAGSWACDPKLGVWNDKNSLDPFDADLARTKLKQGLAAAGVQELKLTVKYPLGDAAVASAVKALCEEVEKTLEKVKLTPEALSPYELREAVEKTHSYELAYYSYDHVDETYWLMPLLGDKGREEGVEPYLGYNGPLVSKVRQADALRHFPQVLELTHAIHRQFLETEMPLIPLWQLDHLYAYRRGVVEMPPVDAQRLFARIEEWAVRR